MNLETLGATSPINAIHFELHSMVQGSFSHNLIVPQQHLDTYIILAIEEGEGVLVWNNQEHHLLYGTCFLIDPDSNIEIKNVKNTNLCLWLLTFSVHSTINPSSAYLKSGEFCVPSFESLIRGFKGIAKHQNDREVLEQMANHSRFQKVIGGLLPHIGHNKTTESSRQAVSEIIAQLKENYQEDVSVEELAARAQISNRRFTHWFKLLTGTNVSGYMTTLRMNQAKQLLLSGGRLQEIASTVGYRDEFYFNRRFKQTVGISPGQFIRNHKKKQINICAMSCLGHLLALGIRPAAAAKNLTNNYHLRELSSDIHKVNSIPFQLDEIANLHPELILAADQQDYDKLSKVAPTLLFSANEHKPPALLRMLGETFGKQNEAEQWILQYKRKTQRNRAKLAGIIPSHETFSAIEIRTDSIYVFGNYWCRGAYNLYDGLELAAPAIIQHEMIDKEAYRIISEEQLPLYVGDHLFLTVVDPVRFKQLSNTPWWKSMPAVSHNQVYQTNLLNFGVSDPISLYNQLDIQMKLLLAR
ncbi:helix-turn-helix domain-containing protein [Paenibacillus sp. IHBB 10380]|uniref:helix-turn-helix domain-containing protein n=1 Tax=Paenibacillus sp. IHBB 10380 TaxID=1566358 RepID=UPI0005CFD0CE|nr:helix-turn-helix domain-containing protein [Paenibacillus sp. IHBB 10380]AJS60166.1 hypothetical protein UB51_18755 [Paenibacillus sp. IHBB 10380]